MDTNPYSSPREVATGGAPSPHAAGKTGLQAVLKGIGVGALLGAATGAAIVVATMWISHRYRVPGSPADTLTEIVAVVFFGSISSILGAVLGAIGFGVFAVARRFRTQSR